MLLVAAVVGGGGAVARYLVAAAVQRRTTTGFALGTFAVNLSGAFLLGLAVGAGIDEAVPAAFLGGYTTFSTWMVESTAAPGHRRALDVVATLAGGLSAAYVGRWIGSLG